MDNLVKFREEFVLNLCFRMDESLRMVSIALDKITEDQLWQKPNGSLNSIGNMILHLCGNMRQYGITSLNDVADKRDREAEFNTQGGYSKLQIFNLLKQTVDEVKATLTKISTDRLLSYRSVQGFNFSGIGNSVHVVEHFSYHTGQIAFWVKQLNNEPLGFYDGHDLNLLNNDAH
ncbi:DinB family protein [uncultured Croceitalea sp.]|uniref:DinB family protein n=1 Tax=uncultured Croceitalea sp. TaxID=1798908 RepID=UPI00330573F7